MLTSDGSKVCKAPHDDAPQAEWWLSTADPIYRTDDEIKPSTFNYDHLNGSGNAPSPLEYNPFSKSA